MGSYIPDIPEGYKVWLIPHTDDDGNHWGNVIVKGDKVVVCDECPCESHCWFLFSSECEVEIIDDENGQSRIVTWTDPYLEEVFCGPEPEIVEQWYFVAPALCHYYAKGPKCRVSSNNCDEEISPLITTPNYIECCNYAPISTGCWELPFEWKEKTEIYKKWNADHTAWTWDTRTRSYKVYKDYQLDNNPIHLGSWSAGDSYWVEWKVHIADVVGKLYVRYIYPDDTYVDELVVDSKMAIPEEDGTCPADVTIWLCPTWEAQLLLCSDFASDYNDLWYDPDSEVRPNAFVCANGILMSEPCNFYCHLRFTASCDKMEHIEGCPCIGDIDISTHGAMDIWEKPFPYNGTDSDWYAASGDDIYNSGWLTEDEEHPNSYWRSVSSDKCDTTGTLVELLRIDPHFEGWYNGGGHTEIGCTSYETPKKCPSQSCTEHPQPRDKGCPPEPDLGCFDGIESDVLASFTTNSALEAHRCASAVFSEFLGEGVACPGQQWRIIDVGGPQPGFTADFEECACKEINDDGEEVIVDCDSQSDTGCGTGYGSGIVNDKGELEGLEEALSLSCWSPCGGYHYWGYLELQVAGYDCETGSWTWPNC